MLRQTLASVLGRLSRKLVLTAVTMVGCSGHVISGSGAGSGGAGGVIAADAASTGASTEAGTGGRAASGGVSGSGGTFVGGTSNMGAGGTSPDNGGGSGGDADGGVCFSGPLSSVAARPPSLLFLVDRSAAMGCKVSGAPSAFDSLRSSFAALAGLVKTPMSIGVEFFGPGDGDAGQACAPSSYETPLLDVAPFPADAPAIDAAFAASLPPGAGTGGGTPLLPAVEGALAHAERVAATAARAPAIVLVVGTEATTCGALTDVSTAVRAAAERGMELFVIVVPTPSSACAPGSLSTATAPYDAIAQSAALTPIITAPLGAGVVQRTGTDFSSAFEAAVSRILGQRASDMACLYALPAMPPGFLEHTVTVTYAPASGQAASIAEVPKASCSGFYYDDASAPTAVGLCPTYCMTLQSEHASPMIEVSCASAGNGAGGNGAGGGNAGGGNGTGGAPDGDAGRGGVPICPITAAFPVGDYYVDAVDESHKQSFSSDGSVVDVYEAARVETTLTIKPDPAVAGTYDVILGEYEFDRAMRQDLSDGVHFYGECSVGLTCPNPDSDRVSVIVNETTGAIDLEFLHNHATSNDADEMEGFGWPKCAGTSATTHPAGVPTRGAFFSPAEPVGVALGCTETIGTAGQSPLSCPESLPAYCSCKATDAMGYDELCCKTE